ncbi:hypothetical protein [Vulgatibacter sp.]|uniref:hypothetical protein n=1 Tax=Vulgatibacter sp. TaxID=1971226 RepID=UPI003562E44B
MFRALFLVALIALPAAAGAAEKPFAVGLKADLLLPVSDVSATGALALEMRYRLPFHERRLAVGADVGWYQMGGVGDQVDPQLGVYQFDWRLHTLPIHLGLEYMPPLPELLPGLRPFAEAGFAMSFLWSSANYVRGDGSRFIEENPGEGLATGLYLGAGGAWRLGPGDLVGQFRWVRLVTDMEMPWRNGDGGDVGGSNVYAGYRLLF